MTYRSLVEVRLAAILLLAALPAKGQKVTTTYDGSFAFKSGNHYSWGKNHIITRQGRANDELIDKKIVEEVNRSLQSKGFVEDSAHPDFYISYDAGPSDLAMQVEGQYTGHPPISTAVPTAIYSVPQNVWYSVDGHIAFHMVDAKSNKPVWTALAIKKIRDPHKGMKDTPKQIEQIVSKSFQKFPPKVK